MEKMKIAICGGIGSGKSTVASVLRELGYPVFSCDEIYTEIINSAQYIEKIAQAFEGVVIDGKIDRAKLAEQVFGDNEKLQKLNAIAHPLIMQSLREQMDNADGVSVAEVPLLLERGFQDEFDKVIVVVRDKEERIRSVQLRDGENRENIEKRISAQFDYDTKVKDLPSDKFLILLNSGDEWQFRYKIKSFFKSIIEQS